MAAIEEVPCRRAPQRLGDRVDQIVRRVRGDDPKRGDAHGGDVPIDAGIDAGIGHARIGGQVFVGASGARRIVIHPAGQLVGPSAVRCGVGADQGHLQVEPVARGLSQAELGAPGME